MLAFYLSLLPDDAAKCKFEQLYTEHRHTMLWIAQQILQDHYLAEDAVHEAFLRILANYTQFTLDDCNKTRALIVIIVKNIALDMLRKKKVQAEQDFDEHWDLPASDINGPEQALADKEEYARLLRALQKMKSTYVDVLILHVLYEYSNQEIAALTGLSPENVRVRLFRGRRQLAALLNQEE